MFDVYIPIQDSIVFMSAKQNGNGVHSIQPPHLSPPLPPPSPVPTTPTKVHPFFETKEQKAARIALEKEQEEALHREEEERAHEALQQLEQKNKSLPPASIFLTKEQKRKMKIEKEKEELQNLVKKAKEEDAKLSEGKEAHPFLLPRAFERIEVCSSRYSSYPLLSLLLTSFSYFSRKSHPAPKLSMYNFCACLAFLISLTSTKHQKFPFHLLPNPLTEKSHVALRSWMTQNSSRVTKI